MPKRIVKDGYLSIDQLKKLCNRSDSNIRSVIRKLKIEYIIENGNFYIKSEDFAKINTLDKKGAILDKYLTKILNLLEVRDMSLKEITSQLNISSIYVQKHLNQLILIGKVKYERPKYMKI